MMGGVPEPLAWSSSLTADCHCVTSVYGWEQRTKAGPLSATTDKGGAKAPDKKGKGLVLAVEPSKETKLRRRDDVEPPQFKGKPMKLLYSSVK